LSDTIKWYLSPNFALYEEELGTMLPRRHRDIPVANPAMEEDMR